jgi:tRNA threonylcarbamoyl adenosine modification protein (Sua5/YciO/YrdC/YwlC family)
MTQYFQLHPQNPQLRLLKQAVKVLHDGGIVALPTDSCYALVCHLDDKDAVAKLRRLRGVDDKHHLTLLCRDLSEIAVYAKIDNWQYRLLKATTPGPYTFILEATKEVPRRLSHPARKTIGLRIPENRIAHALLEDLGQPLLGTTLILPGETEPLTEAGLICEKLAKQIDLVIDGGPCGLEPTTVIDISGSEPVLIRQGRGDIGPFGIA